MNTENNLSYSILAKPTVYAGVNFRSRLEAKWAAFFDAVGWTWEYEPATEFRGWMPDFRLLGAKRDTFCEVKPIESADEDLWVATATKIMASGILEAHREPLILGAWPFGDQLGRILQVWDGVSPTIKTRDSVLADWLPAHFGCWEDGNGRLGFCAGESGDYTDRIYGGHDGGRYGALCHGRIEPMVRAAWAAAGNATQWRPSR